jgi:tight adherence protein B
MSIEIIILVGVAIFLLAILGYFFINLGGSEETDRQDALRNLVQSQRSSKRPIDNKSEKAKYDAGTAALLAAKNGDNLKKRRDITRPGFDRLLYYARWSITANQYLILKWSITFIIMGGIYPFVRVPLLILVFILAPLLIDSVLQRAVKKRFNNFDKDYPDFLMSLVSRIKSGMNSFTAIDSAAGGFDERSLLRAEVMLMLERVKLGIQEEQAIGEFGETVPHPEIELFVQALILSRRVGGNLSTVIERLAKQVRKRQEFRKKAIAAVAQERGAGFMVSGIMTMTMVLVGFVSPELLSGAFENDSGQLVFQGGLLLVGIGFYLSRVITEIKV